VYRNKK